MTILTRGCVRDVGICAHELATHGGQASLDTADGQVVAIHGGGCRTLLPEDPPLSEVIARINERFGTNTSDTDRLFADQVAEDIVGDEQVQVQALANDEKSLGVGFDTTWMGALTGRLSTNETFAFELLNNSELRAALVEEYRPDIFKRARVALQRTFSEAANEANHDL